MPASTQFDLTNAIVPIELLQHGVSIEETSAAERNAKIQSH